jgi:hypothetical protein
MFEPRLIALTALKYGKVLQYDDGRISNLKWKVGDPALLKATTYAASPASIPLVRHSESHSSMAGMYRVTTRTLCR